MTRRQLLLSGAAALAAPAAAGDRTIRIAMKPCSPVRLEGWKPAVLDRRGRIDVGGESYSVYLARASGWPIRNSAGNDSSLFNTSARLYIDSSRDGRLTDDEVWPSNLPVRIGDRMFAVEGIASDGSEIRLAPAAVPLGGVVIGRKSPQYAYRTADGRAVTPETYRGRALLLDIWSIT